MCGVATGTSIISTPPTVKAAEACCCVTSHAHTWQAQQRHTTPALPHSPSIARSAAALALSDLDGLLPTAARRPMADAAAAAAIGSTCRFCRPWALCSVTRSSCTVGAWYMCPAPVCRTGCLHVSQDASAQKRGGTSPLPEPTGPAGVCVWESDSGSLMATGHTQKWSTCW